MLSMVSSVFSTSLTSTSENLSEHWTRMWMIHIAFSLPFVVRSCLLLHMNSECAGENRFHHGKSRGIALACENLYNNDQRTSSPENPQCQFLQKVCHTHCRQRITVLSCTYQLYQVNF